jgi:DNA-binding SARP family transcriptional activator
VGAQLEFAILGPLEVRRDGAPVAVGGPRQRALLVLLLCQANRVVSRDRLIAELMDERAVEDGDHALRVQISRLRKALDGDGQRLLTRAPGYVLRVGPDELDLQGFEDRVARAREQADPARAAALLREAEALWRGPPLEGLEPGPSTRLEVQRLEELRMVAVEDRVDAELALGRHAALCPELEALVA